MKFHNIFIIFILILSLFQQEINGKIVDSFQRGRAVVPNCKNNKIPATCCKLDNQGKCQTPLAFPNDGTPIVYAYATSDCIVRYIGKTFRPENRFKDHIPEKYGVGFTDVQKKNVPEDFADPEQQYNTYKNYLQYYCYYDGMTIEQLYHYETMSLISICTEMNKMSSSDIGGYVTFSEGRKEYKMFYGHHKDLQNNCALGITDIYTFWKALNPANFATNIASLVV